MDPESIGKETIIRVTSWLRGRWEMRRRAGPVQQWVDSIPSPAKSHLSSSSEQQKQAFENSTMPITSTEPKDIPVSMGTKPPTMTVSAPINVPNSPAVNTVGIPSSVPHNRIVRDPSLQSDSSHCSSIESLLELRRADPEAILLGLGFGGCSSSPQDNGSLSRIPKRFLQPSKLKGIAINDFVKQQQETSESFDSVSLGYKGLTGSPYIAPSEIVQKIMDRLREHETHEIDPYAMYNCYEQYSPLPQNGTLSVLSPDNRQFLERPRSKSPDMRNKRMIIGQKSFAFGNDGDLIEINPKELKSSHDRNTVGNYSSPPNDVENTDRERMKISGKVSILKGEKTLSKQLSFDADIELCEPNAKSITSTPKENIKVKREQLGSYVDCNIDVPNLAYNEENDITPKHSDIRRASDGSCEVRFSENLQTIEGRRYSDGNVHANESCNTESTLPQKRKTLKRQIRISDLDALDYCNSPIFISNPSECKESDSSFNDSDTYENAQLIDQDKRSVKFTDRVAEGTHSSVEQSNDTLIGEMRLQADDTSCAEEDKPCDYEEKPQEACTRDENCMHRPEKKYWKKMEKIIKKNKKLENMVAKNRREMAEIREMLNNVLSVRMEPGF